MRLTQISDLTVVYPRIKPHKLELNLTACKLTVFPQEGDFWVKGTLTAAQGTFIPKIEENDGSIKIAQEMKFAGLRRFSQEIPVFDLYLGNSNPYELMLNGGASQAYFELGGLPITLLSIKNGAGDFKYHFSAPNPETISLLKISSGAGNLEFHNLANANFRELQLEGGAAHYKLSFGQALRRDTTVKINTGVSSVEIDIPEGTAAKVTTETTLSKVNFSEGWIQQDGALWTPQALSGQGPRLTIEAKIAVGSLSLKVV